MAGTARFTIGAAVTGSDGDIGKLTRVVVDPIARAVTHLVVEPKHLEGLSRLVPIGLVGAVTPEQIKLRAGAARFEQLDPAEETQFLPIQPGSPASAGVDGPIGDEHPIGDEQKYGPGEVLSWPYYSLALEGRGFGPGSMGVAGALPLAVTYDKVPLGEVAIRRGEHVHATDGEIGRVQGLVIDTSDQHVTHVLLAEGHLWGRKEVAIPVSAVARVDDGIWLKITKQDVQDLPPVDIAHPAG
ncbi:MAG TPA: PRC-barrel domain-containing protein [Streptosporangiaceae bacterium]|jgi:sporulation protein YlmC with PRC-barrel domain